MRVMSRRRSALRHVTGAARRRAMRCAVVLVLVPVLELDDAEHGEAAPDGGERRGGQMMSERVSPFGADRERGGRSRARCRLAHDACVSRCDAAGRTEGGAGWMGE